MGETNGWVQRFRAGPNEFPIYHSRGSAGENLRDIFESRDIDAALVVNDRESDARALEAVRLAANGAGIRLVTTQIAASEDLKSLVVLEEVLSSFFRELNGTRKSAIIAVGGGIASNLAGFAAAIIYRGIRLVHVATTLLSAHDVASSSLKQAINFDGRKNVLGAYYTPCAVVVDVEFLSALPPRELSSGVGELLKNGLLFGGKDLEIAREAISWLQSGADVRDQSHLTSFISAGIAAKQRFLLHDEFERKDAVVFEFGHTFGHALELTLPDARHGECVALGSLFACRVAQRLGLMNEACLEDVSELVQRLQPHATAPKGMSFDRLRGDLLRQIRTDNKRGYITNGSELDVAMVLIDSIGSIHGDRSLPITAVPHVLVEEEVSRFVLEILSGAWEGGWSGPEDHGQLGVKP